jgi:hypothetical protein
MIPLRRSAFQVLRATESGAGKKMSSLCNARLKTAVVQNSANDSFGQLLQIDVELLLK